MEDENEWTQMQVDSQVLSCFMSCPQKYEYIFEKHLVPIIGVSKPIEKGQLSHIGLHHYWNNRIKGKDFQETALEAIELVKLEGLKFQNLEAKDVQDVAENFVSFFKHLHGTPQWNPLAAEFFFRIKAYEDPKIRLRIYLTGRIDLVMRSPQGRLVPVDHKSESERWFYSSMRNQFKIYALACNSNIAAVQRFGFQKTVAPEEKFKLELINFDPDVLDEFKNEILPYWCKQLLIAKSENYYPMNTSSCTAGHFACQFSDKYNNGGICSVSRQLREQKLMRFFKVGEPWNPEEF